MASNPTDVNPIIFDQAMGINDSHGSLKRQNGTIPFAVNLLATSDVWDRRQGRDYCFQYTGLALGIGQFIWDDGLANQAVQVGDALYDFTAQTWFSLDSGKKLIIQSEAGDWWDVTPDVNGQINPVTVAIPATSAQTSDFVVQHSQSFGVLYPSRTILLAIDRDSGIYTITMHYSASTFQLLNDLVFSYSSGKHFISEDIHGNSWKLAVDNDGTPIFFT